MTGETVAVEQAEIRARIAALEAREESTRRRVDHVEATADRDYRSLVAAMEAIRLDVHALVVGGRIRLAVILTLGAGVLGITKWTLDHHVRDLQIQNSPAEWRKIP